MKQLEVDALEEDWTNKPPDEFPHEEVNCDFTDLSIPIPYDIELDKIENFLKSRGYEIVDYEIISPRREETSDEERALDFLFWEWDYSFSCKKSKKI